MAAPSDMSGEAAIESSTSGGKIGQALLKRRQGMSTEAFRQYYVEHHGPVALPWCFAMGVTYYAQIHRPLHWASEEAREKYGQFIDLEEWDAVAEMLFPSTWDFANWMSSGTVGKQYFQDVIMPDERRFLLCNAIDHLQGLDAGSVAGKRVVLIANGEPKVEFEVWQKLFDAA